MANGKWTKAELLSRPVEHVDITKFDARPIVKSYREMAYSSRTLANAADIYSMMLKDKECAVILTLAGSLVSPSTSKAESDVIYGPRPYSLEILRFKNYCFWRANKLLQNYANSAMLFKISTHKCNNYDDYTKIITTVRTGGKLENN